MIKYIYKKQVIKQLLIKGGDYMNNNYTLLHLHSDYSLLDSTTKFEKYVDWAVENGMTSIASTEHG